MPSPARISLDQYQDCTGSDGGVKPRKQKVRRNSEIVPADKYAGCNDVRRPYAYVAGPESQRLSVLFSRSQTISHTERVIRKDISYATDFKCIPSHSRAALCMRGDGRSCCHILIRAVILYDNVCPIRLTFSNNPITG